MPQLYCPEGVLSVPGPGPTNILARKQFGPREIKEFTKTAEKVAEAPLGPRAGKEVPLGPREGYPGCAERRLLANNPGVQNAQSGICAIVAGRFRGVARLRAGDPQDGQGRAEGPSQEAHQRQV